jgi:hypothetical protein
MASMYFHRQLTQLAGLLLLAVEGNAVVLPVNYDFEISEGYSLGQAIEGNGWTFNSSISVSVVNHAFSGDQSLSVAGSGWLAFTSEGWVPGSASSITWIDFYLKPIFADSTFLPAQAQDSLAAITGFVKKTELLGEVYVVDGDGTGGGEWMSSNYTVPITNEQGVNWLRVSYRIDYASKRWDLFLDGNLVKADLGFADNTASPFSRFRVKPDSEKATFLDYFYAGSDNPLFADTSGTGLPDSWFLAHGLNPTNAQRYGDPDNDGVDNLTEFNLGLSPNGPDTDGDGVFDRRELLWGTDPKLAEVQILGDVPFSDGFEADAIGAFITGTRLWRVQGDPGAIIEIENTGGSPEGLNSLSLTGSQILLERRFADSTHASIVWLDFYVKATPQAEPPADVPMDVAAVFYFTAGGKIAVLNGGGNGGGEWRTLWSVLPEWNRLSLRMDYLNQRWSLWVNGIQYAEHLGFSRPVPYFSGFMFQHGGSKSGALDALVIGHDEPSGLDIGGSGTTVLPVWWQLHYFAAVNVDPLADADSDGLSNLEEYSLGRIPTVADATSSIYVDNSSGHDVTYNGQSAAPDRPSVGYGPKATLSGALVIAEEGHRIIISAGPEAYSEAVISLSGRNLVIRPSSDIHIKGL